MISALIADDESILRQSMREQLQAVWPELNIVAEAQDGESAVALLQQFKPDIAFLDIQMPGLSGLEVAARAPAHTRVVFITAYHTHAVAAFEADAVDYVLKPVELSRLGRVVGKLQRALASPQQAPERDLHELVKRLETQLGGMGAWGNEPGLQWLKVSVGAAVRMVETQSVQYFESDTKYTRVVAQDCDGLIRTPIKELQAQLGDDFMEIHRGVLVNRRFIHAIFRRGETMELEIRGRESRLKVSASHQHQFRSM